MPDPTPIAISILAATIAEQITDNDKLILAATALTQLGDTLATIAALRNLEK